MGWNLTVTSSVVHNNLSWKPKFVFVKYSIKIKYHVQIKDFIKSQQGTTGLAKAINCKTNRCWLILISLVTNNYQSLLIFFCDVTSLWVLLVLLIEMLVLHRFFQPPAFWKFYWYPFIVLGGERHCESKVSRTWTYRSRVQHANHWAYASKLVPKLLFIYLFIYLFFCYLFYSKFYLLFQEGRNVQHANKLFIMNDGKLHPNLQRKDGHITKPRKENSLRWWTF